MQKTLGVITPSFGPGKYFTARIERAVKNAEALGFKVKFGKYALESNGYIAETAEHRADDFVQMFKDAEVDIVISMIGGNHSNQILKYIDWEIIKNNPKPFVGYSDVSVLHFALYTQTEIHSYYGPAFITQFGEFPKPFKETVQRFNDIFLEDKKEVIYKPSEYRTEDFIDRGIEESNTTAKKMEKNIGWKRLQEGKAEGEILGGCIPSINHLLGTKYRPDMKDKIFFIDLPEGHTQDSGLPISELDSYLADFDNIGLFDQIQGLIIGRSFRYSKDEKESLEKIIMKYIGDRTYPVVLDFDIGHTDPMVTIQLGSRIVLDSQKNQCTISRS